MTTLTLESLEQALMQMAGHIEAMEERIALRPMHLIVPPAIFRNLMWRPPIRKARGMRGRKRAVSRRPAPVLWKMMRGQA